MKATIPILAGIGCGAVAAYLFISSADEHLTSNSELSAGSEEGVLVSAAVSDREARAAGVTEQLDVCRATDRTGRISAARTLQEEPGTPLSVMQRIESEALFTCRLTLDAANDIEGLFVALINAGNRSVESEVLDLRVRNDPYDVLREALQLRDPVLRRNALRRVGAAWASHDPEAALAQAATLPPELQDAFRSTVATEWAKLDPTGFFAYADAATSLDTLVDGLQFLIASDAARVFDITRRRSWTSRAMESLQVAAASALVERDPLRALVQIESLPSGRSRELVLASAASSYARQDPAAALAWAEGLQPRSTFAESGAIRGIAETDPVRAFELTTELGDTQLLDVLSNTIATAAVHDPREARELVSNLIGREDIDTTPILAAVMSSWVGWEAESAIGWMIENGNDIDEKVVSKVASTLATTDVERAVALADGIPLELRDAWIAEVAGLYGRHDAERALSWITRFQGQPGYDAALTRAIIGSAVSSPRLAAQMTGIAGPVVERAVAENVALSWMAEDPAAAAQWALNLKEPEASSVAVDVVAGQWLRDDAAAAQRWALDLPRGGNRDRALAALILWSDVANLDSAVLVDAFSSRGAADSGIAAAIERILYRDPEKAESLVGFLTDPALGQQKADKLSSMRGRR